MMRCLAALLLCCALAPALAEEPALKPPPAAKQPAPSEQEFYVISARAIERVNQVIQGLQQEIERLRAIVDKGNCS